MFLAAGGYAREKTLFDLRNEAFRESKRVKEYLTRSKDVVLMNSLADSCILAVTQLDAYLVMLGIFNTIAEEDWTDSAIGGLDRWLEGIKQTNELNIRSLAAVAQPNDARTTVFIKRLKKLFTDLNEGIDSEKQKISLMQRSLRLKGR